MNNDNTENEDSTTNIKIEKKRGRKPKNSIEIKDSSTVEEKVPKKRGRKPKNKPVEIKIPKKRGRKPTGKILTLNKGEISRVENDEDCIIAHIPLQESDIEKFSKKSSISDSINVESENDLNEVFEDNILKENNEENELSLENPTLFKDNNNISDNKYVKHLENKIEFLKKELESQSEKNTSVEIFSNDYNIKKLMNNIIDTNEENIILNNKKDIHCWWCCHKFNNTPFPLPNKYYKNKFHVFGVFCSPSCALSYNLDINDHKIWERNSLIVKLYNTLTDQKLDCVNPSLPRQSLDIFGGPYSINEFRANNETISNSRFMVPPMVPIITLIEESYKERNTYNWDKKVNLGRYHKLTTNMKLKRTKPLSNKPNNLEKVMGLRKIKISD